VTTPRPHAVILGLACAWCLAFPLLGVWAQLNLFADGALFSYGVAAGDGWAFHWRQIPVRAAAFAAAALPGELWGRFSGDPAAGVTLYAALHGLAPAIGLAVTWAIDRSAMIRHWAALSTALLAPVVFGFPTELWITLAALWPAYALAWTPSGKARWLATAVALAVVVLSHEAGLIWAATLLAALACGPERAWRRALVALIPGLLAWIALKLAVHPDPYVADVLRRNAWTLFDAARLASPLVLTIAAALAAWAALRRLGEGRAVVIVAAALLVWWLWFEPPLHAWDRYYLRALLLVGAPLLILLAAWMPLRRIPLGALALVTLVHAGETARFVAAWRGYTAEVRALAAQPGPPGDATTLPGHAALGWNSTTPFLSILLSPGYAPVRLVIDPTAGYVWFDCATAKANAAAPRALPARTRAMIRQYTCARR